VSSKVNIGASTFLIGRVDSSTLTDVEVDVQTSTVDIRASTVDQSSPPLLYHNNVTFNPTPTLCADIGCHVPSSDDLNLFARELMITREECEPYAAVDHTAITDHIRTVLAAGSIVNYNYIVSWLAHILQYPWRKLCTALILQGPEGVGKSSILSSFAKVFLGPFSICISRMGDISGRFTGMLANKLLCH